MILPKNAQIIQKRASKEGKKRIDEADNQTISTITLNINGLNPIKRQGL